MKWFYASFEAMALELMKHIPLSKLGEHLQEDGERLMRIATYYVNKSKEKADYSKITSGGIDETSRKKGHNYLTTFVNFKTKSILYSRMKMSRHGKRNSRRYGKSLMKKR
ncbi:MAG: hypothetical protein Q9M97_05840 [Candidatus Gracilibacteria bacterium]|nr:hypothetical protein [Candidatus Gracilibacteria bacterium]